MKFKSAVMNLDEFFRPDESSWPMVLLEIFMPHSVNWPAKSRLDKICEFQDYIMEYECDLKANESNSSECGEFVESDIEDEESQFNESEGSNQQSDSMHNVDSSSNNENQEEEICDSSNGLPSSDKCECVKIHVVEVLS